MLSRRMHRQAGTNPESFIKSLYTVLKIHYYREYRQKCDIFIGYGNGEKTLTKHEEKDCSIDNCVAYPAHLNLIFLPFRDKNRD